MRVPVLVPGTVYHHGRLDPQQKREHSQEGHCLSVSRCPEAWARIARLGGAPLWSLTKPAALFLDVLRVLDTKQLRRQIEQWAVWSGYGAPATRWRAWTTDEEGEWRYTTHLTEAQARNEIEDVSDEGPNGPPVDSILVLTGTAKLALHLGVPDVASRDVADLVAMLWADLTVPQLDGVWWTEVFAPERLSAPRGGVFPRSVSSFTAMEIEPSRITDEDRTPKRRFIDVPIHTL